MQRRGESGQPVMGRRTSPVIMITAYGDADTKRTALENGAEALLTKPIDFGMLRSEINTRVERAA
jgi:DNA-binding response OmpR family regulator